MSKESQYLILNTQMKVIGVTDINGATPFSGDLITRQIADTDNTTDVSDGVENYNTNNDPNANSKNWNHTGEITVAEGYPDSYKVAANNYLMYWDSNAQHYYLMYISQEIDAGTDASGRHVNTYELENVLITNMNDYIPLKATFKDVDAETAFTALFTDSNWQLDFQAETALLGTIEFDGTTNAMNYLQSLLQTYDVEMDAYAELYSDGNIKNLVAKIVDKLGTDKHHWVADYGGDNVIGITRTTVYSNVVTKLHVLNSNGNSIADVNGGKDYLVNDEANRAYNPNWQHGTYLEGTVTFPTVLNYSALKSLGQRQLDLFSHPRVSYEVTPSARFNPGLGDNIRGTDRKMEPELVIDARAISVSHSKADYTRNLVQFGEFVTLRPVTPSYIQDLFNKMDSTMRALIDDVRNGRKAASVHLVTPTGANWTTAEDSKTVIAKVFVDSVNINTYLSSSAFIWQKTDPVTGIHDTDWEALHANDGSQIKLADGDVGTITCKISGAFLKDDPEIINQENYQQVWSYNFKNSNKDPWGEGIYRAPQYVHIDDDNGFLIFSSAYDNDAKNTKQRGSTSDTKYHRFTLDGKYMDSMVLQGGGHGSSFGYQYVDGMPEIWTTIQTESDGDFLGHVKYQPNKVVKLGDKTVVKMCPLKNFKRISVDFEHGWVLAVAAYNGLVEVVSMDNVKAGKWTPTYLFNTSDYDFKQWAGAYQEGMHELQSNDIYFPYVFLNSGNYDNKDERLSICINVITESQVFRHVDTTTMLPDGLIINPANDSSSPFEPETIGYYHNNGKPYLLQGFDYHRINDSGSDTSDSLATLWKTDLIMRDDSGDVTANDDTANDDTTDGADSVDEGDET